MIILKIGFLFMINLVFNNFVTKIITCEQLRVKNLKN